MNALPDNARQIAPQAQLAFAHHATVRLPRAIPPLEAWNRIMARPLPFMALAFRLRDALSAPFGVARIGGFSGARRSQVRAGDKLDFFEVEEIAADALVLTARDTHLEVMTSLTTKGAELTLASSVVTRNRFGRVYMLPVGPAHKLIVAAMLARLKREMEAEGG